MSMTQLVIGSALGFFVAQGVLYSMRHLIGWLQRSDARKRILRSTPSLGSTFIGAFIKYAAPVGAGAALITLGVGCRRPLRGEIRTQRDDRRHLKTLGSARIGYAWLSRGDCRTCGCG